MNIKSVEVEDSRNEVSGKSIQISLIRCGERYGRAKEAKCDLREEDAKSKCIKGESELGRKHRT